MVITKSYLSQRWVDTLDERKAYTRDVVRWMGWLSVSKGPFPKEMDVHTGLVWVD